MSTSHRLRKSRQSLDRNHDQQMSHSQHHLHRPLEMCPVPDDKVATVFLVAKRPPLSAQPLLWRWLARLTYRRMLWCPDYGIEYQGIYTDEAAARFAASGPGMFYMELPLNASLPDEACQFGVHDFPHSEESQSYRKRKLPFIAVPRERMAQLEEKVEQVYRSAQA